MNEIINIEEMIYKFNGVEVMLDSDLAKLYKVETKRINEAAKNNPDKFPERYLIRLTERRFSKRTYCIYRVRYIYACYNMKI